MSGSGRKGKKAPPAVKSTAIEAPPLGQNNPVDVIWNKQTDISEVLSYNIMLLSKPQIASLNISTLVELCNHMVVRFGTPVDNSTVIASVEKVSEDITQKIVCLESQLSDIASTISDAKYTSALSNSENVVVQSKGVKVFESDEPYIVHQEGVIPQDLRAKLIQYCDSQDYEPETGHSTSASGEYYPYKKPYNNFAGSPKPLPPLGEPVIELIDHFKGEFPGLAEVNQCLLNDYQGGESCCPEHDDGESCVCPKSDIFTFALGDDADIIYRSKADPNDEKTLPVKDGDLYIMTKKSQSYWTHRIDKDPSRDASYRRRTISLRTVGKQFTRSTIVIGDSNTEHLKFGVGKGTFGQGMPGVRIKAAKIQEVNPKDCAGYRNIILHVGLNDLKPRKADVPALAENLIDKVESIRSICPTARLTINPILPTKLLYMNNKAIHFNNIIGDYVTSQQNNKIMMLDCNKFVDQSTLLLKDSLGRYRGRDNYHLGSDGYYLLSELIRERVRGARVNGSSYSNVVRDDSRRTVNNYNHGVRGDVRGDVRSNVRSSVSMMAPHHTVPYPQLPFSQPLT